MNLAFPALCILLIALPGIIYRQAYIRGAVPTFFPLGRDREETFNKYPTSIRPLTEEIGWGLITAIILHVVWMSFWTVAFGRTSHFSPNYEKLVFILYGDLKPSATNAPAQIATNLPGPQATNTPIHYTPNSYEDVLLFLATNHQVLTEYFLSLYLFSFVAGRLALRVIRKCRFDHHWMFLRLDDQWFYFLRGEMFSFREYRRFIKLPHAISGTYISIVVAQHDGDYLYKGFLWDFFLDNNGNLDRLLLHNVIRCKFDPAAGSEAYHPTSEVRSKSHRILPVFVSSGTTMGVPKTETTIVEHFWTFERVSSQLFTVKYADCKTLACTYFYIVEAEITVKNQQDMASEKTSQPSHPMP